MVALFQKLNGTARGHMAGEFGLSRRASSLITRSCKLGTAYSTCTSIRYDKTGDRDQKMDFCTGNFKLQRFGFKDRLQTDLTPTAELR